MIEAFLFDMGNVLLHFSHQQMCAQIAAVCGADPAEIWRLMFDEGWEAELERGELSEEGFQQRLADRYQRPVDFAALVNASSDIFVLNAPMVPILRSLNRQGKRLVLLSNTSPSHIAFIRHNYDVLNEFDDFVLSYEVGAMKPDAAIFESALKKIDCPPENCFYTDDISAYVDRGRSFGLQAEIFTTAASLEDQLITRGISVR